MHGGRRVGTMRKKGQARVKEWGGVVCPLRGWGERSHGLARTAAYLCAAEAAKKVRLEDFPRHSSCHSTPPPAREVGPREGVAVGNMRAWGWYLNPEW